MPRGLPRGFLLLAIIALRLTRPVYSSRGLSLLRWDGMLAGMSDLPILMLRVASFAEGVSFLVLLYFLTVKGLAQAANHASRGPLQIPTPCAPNNPFPSMPNPGWLDGAGFHQ